MKNRIFAFFVSTFVFIALAPWGCDGGKDLGGDGGSDSGEQCLEGVEKNGPYTQIIVEGEDSALGIIDPSVEYVEGASSGFMTYTAVPDFSKVGIAIAESLDMGESWNFVGDVAVDEPVSIETSDNSICGFATCEGTLVHESSSLVVDSYDPDPNRRFKVFTHTYFFSFERHLQLGYIALRTGPQPQGPWSETKLFGWDSSSPISSQGVLYNLSNDQTLSELNECLIVGEPGGIVRSPGIIDLALSCVMVHPEGGSSIDVRMLRSEDHGVTWSFVNTLLAAKDGAALGSTAREINGGDLFFANGGYHLIVTPTGPVDFPDGEEEGYRGCVVLSLEDIEAGQVARCDGEPENEAYYLGEPKSFVGACSAAEGASAGGMFIPVPDFSSSVPFKIFVSGSPLP